MDVVIGVSQLIEVMTPIIRITPFPSSRTILIAITVIAFFLGGDHFTIFTCWVRIGYHEMHVEHDDMTSQFTGPWGPLCLRRHVMFGNMTYGIHFDILRTFKNVHPAVLSRLGFPQNIRINFMRESPSRLSVD